MRVTMLLADAAQVVEEKLYILGGGWAFTGPAPASFSVAVLIEVPWHEANRPHHWRMNLVDADGGLLQLPTPNGELPLIVEGHFEVGRPPGTPEGTPLKVPITYDLVNVPLPPGSRFAWNLYIDDQHHEDWYLSFSTREQAPPAPSELQ